MERINKTATTSLPPAAMVGATTPAGSPSKGVVGRVGLVFKRALHSFERHLYGDQYVGDMLLGDGRAHGKGTMIYAGGGRYAGEWRAGLPHGHGVLLFDDGCRYEGEMKAGLRDGQGVLFSKNQTRGKSSDEQDHMEEFQGYRDGLWVEGRFECGFEQWKYDKGIVYEGEVWKGLWHGHGKKTFLNGDQYEGPFRKGKCHGKGGILYVDGTTCVAEQRNGVFHGRCVSFFPDGKKIESEFKEGLLHGKQVITYADERIREQRFNHGEKDDYEKITVPNGNCYIGQVETFEIDGKKYEGVFHGEGLIITPPRQSLRYFIRGSFHRNALQEGTIIALEPFSFTDRAMHGQMIDFVVKGNCYTLDFKGFDFPSPILD